MEMGTIECKVNFDRQNFKGVVSIDVNGVIVKRKSFFKSSKPILIIPYTNIISISYRKFLNKHKIEILFISGVKIYQITFKGDSRIQRIYSSLKWLKKYSY